MMRKMNDDAGKISACSSVLRVKCVGPAARKKAGEAQPERGGKTIG
jgi:hypothetical protein